MSDPLARDRVEKLAGVISAIGWTSALMNVYGGEDMASYAAACMAFAADLRSLLADSLPREGERERIASLIIGAATRDGLQLVNWIPALRLADQIMGRDDG